MNISMGTNGIGRTARMMATLALAGVLAACSPLGMFSQDAADEPIVPVETLYSSAVSNMEANRYAGAIDDLEKLERQHPYSDYNERAKVMITYANFRTRQFDEAILAADRFLALYPSSSEVPYVLFLKGSAYYQQLSDTTRDQSPAADAIDTFEQIEANYPSSQYVQESRNMVRIARDQLAGREMSVGRYYLGHDQNTAAINRFREVVENHQQSSHVEEALYRLTEAYLRLGLVSEAQTATAVLGHNYPSGEWYQRGFDLLQQQGVTPQMVQGNWMSGRA
ncbi:outer membrane protein assembly factor BamD [Pelagibacterium montanilacus]|uniref:outer membrane protein assembly factor BamD n=1 Tax=Pelagibacterium montanilacus TaxID=2185280 RepID=UPI000F8F519D|nr:outer membrane protein assembly factor BamD [Pelagibacterium montanilacus]